MNFLLEVNEYKKDVNKTTYFDWIKIDNDADLAFFIKWITESYVTPRVGESFNYTKQFTRLKRFIENETSIKFRLKDNIELIVDMNKHNDSFNFKLVKIHEYVDINHITTNETIELVKNSKIDVYKVYISDRIYVQSKKNNFYVITKDNIESIPDGANFRDKGILIEDWISINEFAHENKNHLFIGATYKLKIDEKSTYVLLEKSKFKTIYGNDQYILLNMETLEKHTVTYDQMMQHSEML